MKRILSFKSFLQNPSFFPKLSPPPPPSDHAINPLLSRISSNTIFSWHSGASTAHSGSLGFLASQILSKQVASKTYFSSLHETGVCWLKISLQKRPFNVVRSSGSYRRFWKYLAPTPDRTVIGLIGANVVVYYLWGVADPEFMRKHFTISLDNFKSGRLHTMLTCAFSHTDFSHLAANMIGLYFCGPTIGRLFGSEFLLKLYVGGALGGSLFFLLHKALMSPSSEGTFRFDYSRVTGLGASGAVNAIMLLNIFLFPKEIFYVNLIIPVPAVLLGAIIIGTDLWRVKKVKKCSNNAFCLGLVLLFLGAEGERDVSGSGHLGGAAVAALVWVALKKRWIR